MIKINGYDNYFITDEGKVLKKINDNHKERNQWIELKFEYKAGYYYVGLWKNKKCTRYRVHRLVAQYYVDNCLNKPCVNHKDGNKLNNNKDNLEWVTVSENTKHAFDNGLAKNSKGFEDSQSIPVIMLNRNTGKTKIFGSMSEASIELGISKSTISKRAKFQSRARDGIDFEYYKK